MAGTAFRNAATTRLFGDWIATDTDPNDDWMQDGRPLSARAWDLYRNNPLVAAIVETMVEGTLGDCGLQFRSLYAEDDSEETSEHELKVRRQINGWVARCTAGMRADAAGMLTWFDMHRQLRATRRVAGEAFAIRLWKPGRPNAKSGTCWRVVDPSRVCNPHFGPNTRTMFEGVELDGDGQPVAIHVISSSVNLVRYAETKTWTRVAIYAPDGTRNVIHLRRSGKADQIRSETDFAPILGDTKHLDDLKLAHVVGKKANASIALLVNTKDPAAAARADRNGAQLAGNVGIKPLMKYYMGLEDKVTTFGFQFQGAEFDELLMALMQVDTATHRLPVEYVLARLTRTNMAASRSAMMLAHRTFRREQEEHIAQGYEPMISALIVEGVARGEIDAQDGIDRDRLCAGKYLRPAVLWPDPLKEVQAAKAKRDLGISPSTVVAELGEDFEDEIRQTAQDRKFAKAQGVDITAEATAERIVTEPKKPTNLDGSEPAGGDVPADGEGNGGDGTPPDGGTPAKEDA
jgi:lambda family phage portal protein